MVGVLRNIRPLIDLKSCRRVLQIIIAADSVGLRLRKMFQNDQLVHFSEYMINIYKKILVSFLSHKGA